MSDNTSLWITNPMEKSPRFVMCAKLGSMLVSIQGSLIRWSMVNGKSYRCMLSPVHSSELKDAILSPTGKRLCLFTDSIIHVVEIPWEYNSVPDSHVKKFYTYKSQKITGNLKQVLFHPMSYQETCIVVLLDDRIELIEIISSDKVLINDMKSNHIFGVEGYVTDIKKLAFGCDGLTLFALSSNEGGDIYAFYPCLPSQLHIRKHDLSQLFNKSLVLYNELNADSSPEFKRNVILQTNFVSKLIEKIDNFKDLIPADYCLIDIELTDRLIKAQGSFTVSPFPELLYEYTAIDIGILQIDSIGSELVYLAYDNGSILLLFRDLETTMSWDTENFTSNDSFVMIEHVRTEMQNINRIVTDTNIPGKLFLIGDGNFAEVDTTSWSATFAKAITESKLTLISNLQISSRCHKHTLQNNEKIKSIVPVWQKNEKGVQVITDTKTSFFNIDLLDKSIKPTEIEGLTEVESPYKVIFAQPIEEILQFNKELQRAVRTYKPSPIDPAVRQELLSNESNEIQLKELSIFAKDFIRNLSIAHVLGLSLDNRMREQQYEYTRQLQKSQEIINMRLSLKEQIQGESERWTRVNQRQKSIDKRLSALRQSLEKLQDSTQYKTMEISEAENVWFDELKKQVLKSSKFVSSYKELQKLLQHITTEVKRNDNEQTKGKEDEWHELRRILKRDAATVEQCNTELQAALSQLAL